MVSMYVQKTERDQNFSLFRTRINLSKYRYTNFQNVKASAHLHSLLCSRSIVQIFVYLCGLSRAIYDDSNTCPKKKKNKKKYFYCP